MRPAVLIAVAKRCECEAPSRDLDEAVALAIELRPSGKSVGLLDSFLAHEHKYDFQTAWIAHAPWRDQWPIPAFTTSLDAAVTLVPETWTAWELRSHAAKTRFSSDLSRLTECDASQEDWAHGRGATAALALCVASLRARASMVPA